MIDPHLQHRHRQEEKHKHTTDHTDPMSSLISVELNIMDACNRACSFCPHVNEGIYPNRPEWRMDEATVTAVAKSLASFEYKGRVSLSGMGEPFLARNMAVYIGILHAHLPLATIESNSNGDPLNATRVKEAFAAGLTYLYINLYDGPHQAYTFDDMIERSGVDRERVIIRPHWDDGNDWGLTLNNRSGTLKPTKSPKIGYRCHYPFYKLFVDWNGDALFCSNDWRRVIIVGNVHKTPIQEIWLSKTMRSIREKLAMGDRSQKPCRECDIDGTLHGQYSFDVLMRHYNDGLPGTD